MSVNVSPATKLPGVSGGGDPVVPAVRASLERSLGVDVGAVRVHSDPRARDVAVTLSARAVTYGHHVLLGPGEQPTDLALMSHEVAHVVQQQGAPKIQRWGRGASDAYEREAHRASAAVTRGEPFTVRERTRGPMLQRLGLSDALDYFADKANIIPGFRMFTIILGVNPINMSRVDRSAANVLRAVIEFIPGGGLITQALDNYGVFERVGTWVEQQIRTLGMTGSVIRQAINDFLDSLSWTDIFHLGDVWERAKRIFTTPIDRIVSFLAGLVTGILRFIKDAILRPLAALAEGTRGYDLLKAVLGQDPITGDPVPRNADTLIGGFMKLIGQEEIWNNLKRANAVARGWAWFQGALSGLMGFIRQIPGLFISALQSLELTDIVLLPRAFAKVGRVFGGFFSQFFSWAGQQVLTLLEIIFEVLAPAVIPYIKKAAGAFRTIISNPIGFIGNLVRAAIQGFRQFGTNFLSHLRRSLIQWLTGTLSGANIYIPQAFEIREIIKFVLSVLGLTWQNIRGKLVRATSETFVAVLETGFDIVVTLVREGPAAAWEKIKEQLSNLKEMVMGEIMNFVRDRIVTAAITRLVTSLNPAGAFIQAIIAIYNTIMFLVERLRQIAQVVAAFIDSIAAIASGAIGAAANKVEQTMGGLLTLVISFLARLVGLGSVGDAVTNIVNRIRAPIDRALDRVIEWIVSTARRIGRAIVGGARRAVGALLRRPVRVGRERHTITINPPGILPRIMIESTPQNLRDWLRPWHDQEVMPRAAATGTTAAVTAAYNSLMSTLGALPDTADIQPAVMDTILAKIAEIAELVQLGQEIRAVLADLPANQLPQLETWMRSLTSNVTTAAALAQRARAIMDAQTPIPGASTGVTGLGLGLVLQPGGSIRKVYALNDVVLRSASPTAVETRRLILEMYGRVAATLADWERVGGGNVTLVGQPELATVARGMPAAGATPALRPAEVPRAIQGHEEDLIRAALAGGAARLGSGVRVVVGVSQDTVCGRCVVRLSTSEPRPLPAGFTPGSAPSAGTEHALASPIARDVEARMLVMGRDLARALAGLPR